MKIEFEMTDTSIKIVCGPNYIPKWEGIVMDVWRQLMSAPTIFKIEGIGFAKFDLSGMLDSRKYVLLSDTFKEIADTYGGVQR